MRPMVTSDDSMRSVRGAPMLPRRGRDRLPNERWGSMGLNIADIFETVVDTVPDQLALVVRAADGEELRLTFAELDARVNQLARVLIDLGVGPGDHVGCHLY